MTSGYVEERYIEGMLVREQSVSTAIGNLIAIPHGESDYKRNILSTGLVMLLYPEGIAWGTETVKMVIGIAAKGDEHLGVLSRIADTFEDENKVSAFVASGDVDAIHAALTVRLYGADDLRLEEFDLPDIADDEILVRVITDSICMSTYKLLKQGKAHKRCPQDVDTHPIIIGHEFAGDIVKVGKKWQGEFEAGEKFAQQPALNYKGSLASPGYSYRWFGGACTYCVVPHEVMELGCLLHYDGESYFEASLGEPMSCIIGGYNANYHTNKQNYEHAMGVKAGGSVLILGGCGPMGLGAVEYPLVLEQRPRRMLTKRA